ncbi:hypothetical protein [Nocardia sp. NPDC005998]
MGWPWAQRKGGVVGVVDTEHGSASKYRGLNSWQTVLQQSALADITG